MKQGKIWGETSQLFNKNNVSIHRIEINAGGFCSKHKHNYKHNIFFVESGLLKIEHWQNNYDLNDITILKSGESCSIPPNHYHKFTALEDTIALEIYYVELLDDDICRETCGGLTNTNRTDIV
jgi:quercetin dioxygenase-like cupin family protein